MFKVRIPGFIMWAREKWACTACPWQFDRETMQNVEMQGLKAVSYTHLDVYKRQGQSQPV